MKQYYALIIRGEKEEAHTLKATDEEHAVKEAAALASTQKEACTIKLLELSAPLAIWLRQADGAVFGGRLQAVPQEASAPTPCFCSTNVASFNHLSPHSAEVEILETTPNEDDAYDYVVRCTCGRQATVTSYEIGVARCAYTWSW